MNRRRFFKLMGRAAAACALPLTSSRAAEIAGSSESYPASERDAVLYYFKYRPKGAPPAGTWNGVPLQSPFPGLMGDGPYQPTWESLANYGEAPEWYRDAKFGIWAHWSPQCVAEDGDGYAHSLYNEGSPQYIDHCARYGHPTKFGYKDLCPQWTLKNWDPDALMSRYKAAGAKFFFSLANHHDGFDSWNSRNHVWNSVNIGPKRDVVGGWAAAARKQGLRFGVTVHAARNWWWLQVARLCDRTGPYANMPYDGRLTSADGKNQWWHDFDPKILYGRKHETTDLPDTLYVKNFYDRIRDLIDQHDPDLLYFDDTLLPLGWGGMNLGAYFYNHNLKTRGGKMEAVLNVKQVHDDLHAQAVVADVERGVVDRILPRPWQSETCIGDWHYDRKLFQNHAYMKPGEVIHWLVDVVSKNGTFVLNIPGRPDGTIDADEIAILDALAGWIKLNGEGIYATRPWKVFGEGTHLAPVQQNGRLELAPLDASDIRFTQNKKGDIVYAFVMGWPPGDLAIKNLGIGAATSPGKVKNVAVLGGLGKVSWSQTGDALVIQKPAQPPCDFACGFKVWLT
jgi:alpha-L-fucosidase